jgi:hypothetical protein
MRGKTKLISLVAMLSVLLVVSVVFGTGVVNVDKVSFLNAPFPRVEPNAGSATLAFSSSYYLNHSKVVNQEFSIGIDVSGSSTMNLYTWQLNVTWGKDITKGTNVLNLSRITAGSFLSGPKLTSSEELGGKVINSTSYAARYSCFSETVLGDTPGVNGTGRLATLVFKVVGIGSINIKISTVGSLPTKLLDYAGNEITLSATPTDCYFRNRRIGDTDNDGDTDFDDLSNLIACYTYPPGPLGYNRECDFEGFYNGAVDFDDFSVLIGWYTYPPGPLNP